MYKVIAFLSAMSIIVLCCGCQYFYDQFGEVKRIPIPIPERFPYEFEGQIYRVWRGNELQLKIDFQTAYVLLEGVNNPDLGEDVEHQAIEFLHSLLVQPRIKAVIHATDSRKCMVSQVFCGTHHINLEMIRAGWGTFDDSEIKYAQSFKNAQAQARAEKCGIWRVEN